MRKVPNRAKRHQVRGCYMVLGLIFSVAALISAVFTYLKGEPLVDEAVKSGNLWMLSAVIVSHLPMLGVTSLLGSIAFWMFRRMYHFDNWPKHDTQFKPPRA